MAATRDDAPTFEWIEREIVGPVATTDDRPVRQRSLLGANHAATLYREFGERSRHAGGRGFLGGLLVVAAEPARRCERGPLGAAGERLADAGLAALDVLVVDLVLDRLGHTRSNSAARSSTSSITALIVSSTFVFSITGTSVSRARPTMNS